MRVADVLCIILILFFLFLFSDFKSVACFIIDGCISHS